MTHHPIVAQAFYYCIVAIVPTPQPRKPQTCNNIYIYIYIYIYMTMCRFLWQYCLRRRSWPLSCRGQGFEYLSEYGSSSFCLYAVVSCVGRGLCDELTTRPNESYHVSNKIRETSRRGPWPNQGWCAIKRIYNYNLSVILMKNRTTAIN
jgi:hypothetical protein